ncbi:metallophosphoesterase family protein [Rhizobium binxianense]
MNSKASGANMLAVFHRVFGKARRPGDAAPSRGRVSFNAVEFSAIYAIGDVHGCYELLLNAEQRILEDAADSPGAVLVILLGDYVDRGPHSCEVLEHLCRPANPKMVRVTLCGNHEEGFLRLLQAPAVVAEWLRFAGPETLTSYGLDAAYILRHGGPGAFAAALGQAVPDHHRRLLEEMPVMATIGSFVFVHAGVRPGIPLAEQRDRDLVWIREPFLANGPQLPFVVIHGHTPAATPFVGQGRIGIDTGAFATGRLTVLKIAGGRAGFLE